MQLNELTFAGFVGKDAEEFTTKSGTRIVSFNICHTHKGKNGGADISTWIRVKTFGNWCSTAIQIKKGDNAFVKGTMQLSEFTKKDGTKSSMVEVLANSIGVFKKAEKQESSSYDAGTVDYSDIPF